MNREQAKRAAQTLEDVFTPEGNAVVVGRLYTFSDPQSGLYGKGQCAQVTGREHHYEWFPIADLTAKEDIGKSDRPHYAPHGVVADRTKCRHSPMVTSCSNCA